MAKHYGEPEQIARIKKEIEDTERMLNSSDETRVSDVGYFEHAAKHLDIQEVRKSLAMQKKILADMTPTKFSGPKANEAYKYAKQLKQKIIEGMPKQTFVSYPRGQDPAGKSFDFDRAVNEHVAWEQGGGSKRIQLYNNIMKRIDPNHTWEDFNRYTKERA
jgi:hypothetical protein